MALPYGSYNIDYANVVAVPGQSLVGDNTEALKMLGSGIDQYSKNKRQQAQLAFRQKQIDDANALEQQRQQDITQATQTLLQPQTFQQTNPSADQTSDVLGQLGLGQGTAVGDTFQPGLAQLGNEQYTQGVQQQTQEMKIKQAEAIGQLMGKDPRIGMQMLKQIGVESPQQMIEARDFSQNMLNTNDPQERNQMIKQRVKNLVESGRDPKDTLELLNMPQDQQDQALIGVSVAVDQSLKGGIEQTANQKNIQEAQNLKKLRDANKMTEGEYMQALDLLNTKTPEELEAAHKKQMLELRNLEESEKINQEKEISTLEGKIDYTQSNIQKIDDLLSMEGMEDYVGKTETMRNISSAPGTRGADYATKLINFKANLTFEKLQELKAAGGSFGVLSDSDIKIISDAAAALSPDQSPQAHRAELQKIKTTFQKAKQRNQEKLNKYDSGKSQEKVNTQEMPDNELLEYYI